MLSLTEAELDTGLAAIKFHGYSDFFPTPPEFNILLNNWPAFRTYLAGLDLDNYDAYSPPLELSAPKSRINLRRVTLLHPFDLVIYTAIVMLLRDDISKARIPENERRVFSFRAESCGANALYKHKPSYPEFRREVLKRAKQQPRGWIVLADIADFYYRLYQHRVRNAVQATVTEPRKIKLAAALERLLRRFNVNNVSFGIPIGPAASRPLAEAAIIDVDEALLSHNIDFCRYIDDYAIFTTSRDQADWAVHQLGETLYIYHGLTLQTAKTTVIQCSTYTSDSENSVEEQDEVEARFNEIVEELFYDITSLDELNEEQKETIDATDFGAVLEEALDDEPINYKKVTFVLEKLSGLQNEDLVDIVLGNLKRLYPVAHALSAFFREFEHFPPRKKKRIAEALLKPILPNQRYRAPEYYAVWVLDLFANHAAWNHAAQLLHIFRDSASQTIKRYSALAIAKCGSRSEALVFKEAIAAATPLTRTAILIASAKLAGDERAHWRRSLRLSDQLEKAIP
ncbi:MAG TPA: RNA-directed DNA polymerase [Candidatus Dormibacteraeota bacterium]|nr:RNA-directed DNA polymerase [Candidatus Dormibacteraeota bacterium]